MLRIVTGGGTYHNHEVADEVASIQKQGYSVTSVRRVGRDWFLFGDDVTHIYYEDRSRASCEGGAEETP